ncbi:unnamed protein product [Adineta steineri]|uniref:Uncharacterized protein n=1 Tax=Adineta steineri TaxID=433720 RepID=A0A819NFP5_9BILA|nr:unnamed protein product [Adineta steineri]CAF3992805.1 unnamed protein product [Adineta steineri]
MDESPVALFIDHSKRSINDIGTPNDIEGNLADKRKPSENSPFSVGAPPENGKKSALVSVPECLTWNDPAAQAPYTDTYVSTVQSSSHLSLTCSAGDTLTIASHMTTDLIKNKKSETISSKRNSVISKLEQIGHSVGLAPLDENLSNYDGAHDNDS